MSDSDRHGALQTADQQLYNPYCWETQTDPYDVYRTLRDEAPAYFNAEHGFWALSRYDDVLAAARDWESFSNEPTVDLDEVPALVGRGHLLNSDPPAHDWLRRVLRPVFQKQAIDELEGRVRASARDLTSQWRHCPPDAAQALAWALPLHTISDLLAVPAEDRAWVHERMLRFQLRDDGDPAFSAEAEQALSEVWSYFTDLVRARADRPGDDCVSHIIRAPLEDGPLLDDEVVRLCLLLFGAGSETAAGLISTTLWHLAQRPADRNLLATRPDLIPQALEEVLRHDSPIQGLARTASATVHIHGETIERGHRVLLLYGSANRDERRFRDPGVLDLGRSPSRTLAFGNGIHFCLGVHLARLEARIAIEEALSVLPAFELAGPVAWLRSPSTRALTALPLRPAARAA